MKTLLSRAVGKIVDVKNFLFDAGLADQIRIDHVVISVGNITMGGTGKTPFIDFLTSLLEQKGKIVSVVSRNYKAQVRSMARVDVLRADGSKYFGDEPFWLATRHPQASVYVGPHKWQTAQFVSQNEPCDVILIDDGFQHRNLFRQLDIVLLDASVPMKDYEFPPVGRAREDFSALERADVIILTKVNQSDLENIIELEKRIPAGKPIFHMEATIKLDVEFGDRYFAFCGIAKPKSFFNLLPKDFVEDTYSFSDHKQYSEKDLRNIEQQALNKKCNKILTTEKDWGKVASFPWKLPVVPVPLEIKLKEPAEELNVYLDSVFII
jgi:tetraacyldisaccharide 4'-kinase